MGYHAKGIQMTYSNPPILPDTHQVMKDFKHFKKQFGEDGNLMVIGLQSDRFFDRAVFNDWFKLGKELEKIDGINGVVSVPTSINVIKDKENERFQLRPIISEEVGSDAEMDSLKQLFKSLPFYEGILYNAENNSTLMGVRIDSSIMNTKTRVGVVKTIVRKADQFGAKHDLSTHYSGLPFIRSYNIETISKELKYFLVLAICIIGMILFLLFRSFASVFYPILVVLIAVIWCLGIMTLLDYRITVLTGLVPTLIVVIGIPNCVYMLNKYQEEFRKHGERKRAMVNAVSRIGHITLFANLTTAIGFAVFALMESAILKEFGIVSGLSIAGTYFISLIVIPGIFMYLPKPKAKHLKHLDRKVLQATLANLVNWTHKYRTSIQLGALALLIVCSFGLFQLKSEGYLVDDVSQDSIVYTDLKFFENNFKGVMPMDVLIDTKKKTGITKASFMKKLDKVHKIFEKNELFSKPVSLIDGIKFCNQAYFNGKDKFYSLPSAMERSFVLSYLKNTGGEDNGNLLATLTDSLQQVARLSVAIADVGSRKFPEVVAEMKSEVAKVLDPEKYDVSYTGSTFVVMEGYNYLISGLRNSVLFAFLLIAIIIAYLFRSPKMLMIALLPNLIPLAFTASLMGYFGITLKPSTVLIFSVAFGISVDFTIHFLAKYRQELFDYKQSTKDAITRSIQETGFSMIYTAIILLAGFVVFTFSNFTGTFYLGLLTSITLIVALLANLVLLPSVILSIEERKGKKDLDS